MRSLWTAAAKGYLTGFRTGRARRKGIRVFYYHGLVERRADPMLERNFSLISEFQAHIRLLRRFRIASMDELAGELFSRRDSLKTASVISFDDGFANNLIAAEILMAAGIPWSAFIATGPIGSESSTWPEELSLLLLHGQAAQLDALDHVWPLSRRLEREIAFRSILVPMKAMPAPLRRETMARIREQFPPGETARLLDKFPTLRMLSWNEVQQLANAGAEICSHGVHHEIHHHNQPADIRKEELTESKTELEQRLGRACSFFAFPNGNFTPASAEEVSTAGYQLAFTTEHKTVQPGANPFLLPRFDPNSYVSPQKFTRNFFWED